MGVLRFHIKRLRRVLDAQGNPTVDTHWVTLGKAFINTDGKSGSIMLDDRDEVWRLFPKNTSGKPKI